MTANVPCRSAKMLLTGKLYNSRWLLEHFRRDHPQRLDLAAVGAGIDQIKSSLRLLPEAADHDMLRGIEGSAAKAYFSVFPQLILRNAQDFPFSGRSRRRRSTRSMPCCRLLTPCSATRSPVRWNLSVSIRLSVFCTHCAPDEPRSHWICWRSCVRRWRTVLCSRRSTSAPSRARTLRKRKTAPYYLTDDARRTFLAAWQKRKQEPLTHPFLKEKIVWGLVPYTQAMLLARYLRGDLDAYPPFLWK